MAREITFCFENRCELGIIKTPEQNLTAFSKPEGGTREARPTDFPPFFQTNSDSRLRRDELFFRQETGAKSEAILTHSICFDTKRIFAILHLYSTNRLLILMAVLDSLSNRVEYTRAAI